MGANKVIRTGTALVVTILLIVIVPWMDILSSVSSSFISTIPSSPYQPLLIVAIIICTIVVALGIIRKDSNDLLSAITDFVAAIVEVVSSLIESICSIFSRY